MVPLAMSVPVSKVAGVSAGSLYSAAFTGALSGVVLVAILAILAVLIFRVFRAFKKVLDSEPKK